MKTNQPKQKKQRPNQRDNKGRKKQANKTNKKNQPSEPKQKLLPEKIEFEGSLSVGELAKKLHREPSELIKKLFLLGVMATINQELDADTIGVICEEYGVEVERS